MTRPLGLCPACERSGPIGKACPQPVCARRGYHFIPAAFVPSAADGLVDPMLGQQFSEYLVVRKLGTGGAGGVYLALQQPIWMKAALKVLETDDDGPNEAMLQRFRSEAAALARLNHPNIVRLLKFGSERDRPYLVMEYVEENRTLRSVMRQGLRICEIERVLHQLINALEAAHSSGVIHRDIKPANIMLQSVPGEPHYVRLVDFGLAKFVDEGDTTRFLAGTPAYMAPEQIAKEGIGPGSDWYALGAIAFEMITGLRAYSAAVPEQIIALKQDPHFDPCDALAHLRLPTPTLAFLRGLLAHDPSARLSVAAQIRSALTAAFAPLDPEHIPLPCSEEETPTQGISGLPLRAHRLPQRRISARRKVGLIAAATIGAIALGLLLEALTSSPAPRVEAPPAEAPRAEAPLVAAPPPPPIAAPLAGLDAHLPAPPPLPSPPPRLTSEAAYARALTHASAGDADAAAEALREALSESAQPERLRARARGEPAFSRLSSPALDRVLGRKRRRPRPAPTPKLTMERL